MTAPRSLPRFALAGVVAALSLLLSACLISPGKFTSALDIRKDGRFSYSYTGEIYLLGLSKLAEMGNKAKADETFSASDCFKDDGSGDERPCTSAELDSQKQDWQQSREARASKDKNDAEMMRAMLGGIDPSSPKAAEELADRLRKQAGWKTVTYKGDGLFEVDFAIAGQIGHDFSFPTIERFPMANAFIVLNHRADGTVRMDAPGFSGANGGAGSMGGLTQLAMLGAASEADKKGEAMPKFPALDGMLTLTTDAQILANNTDEGPSAGTAGQRLLWTVNARTTAAPTALLRLGN